MLILMLEDDHSRILRFSSVVNAIDSSIRLKIWRDSNRMIQEAGPLLLECSLISLDHDLISEPGEQDLGDGYIVAKWLVKQPVTRPVIIHTSNGDRASWMAGEFDLENWRHFRVLPFGDDWIEIDWKRTVTKLLKKRNSI